MFTQEEINKAYKYVKEDDDNFFNDFEMEYHDPYNENEFKFYGSGVIEHKTLGRFTEEEINKVKLVSKDVPWLATHSAGIQIHFKTDSRLITVRAFENGVHDMKNMNFMAQCGFDLYYKENGQYIYHNSTFGNYIDAKKFVANLGVFREKKEREIVINLPLYIGLVTLDIGLEKGSIIKPNCDLKPGRIVCYGTSILQGGCVSRPGLCITNVLSRYFEREVLNYGFSGAGLLEEEVGEIIASRDDIKLLIIDAEANAGCDKRMVNNFEKFINKFYERYPNLPVIVMNKTKMAIDSFLPRNKGMKIFNDRFLKAMVNKYKRKGKEIYFVDNYHIFDKQDIDSSEFTVDGVHPNDMGMHLLTNSYIKAIKKVKSLDLK